MVVITPLPIENNIIATGIYCDRSFQSSDNHRQ